MTSQEYDVIIIGSGAGGLAAAVPLAQAGKKVLVCEQHEVAGGWTHSFSLEGYRFSPGVHYIGGLQEGQILRRIYEGLGLTEDISFYELNPKGYDHFYLGDKRFDFPKGKENLEAKLIGYFPHEEKGIRGYLNAVNDLINNLNRLGKSKNPIKAIASLGSVMRWMSKTGQDLIDHFVKDPVLKGVLSGQSGDHGLPPSHVSAFVHAGITHHYFDGGYYPKGGAIAIPRAFVRALKKAGGEIRLNTTVEKIIIENNKIKSVVLADGSEIATRCVISNADPEVTFGQLIGREYLSKKLCNKLDNVTYSTSCVSLFFAVNMDLRAAGLDSGNNWFYENENVDELYKKGLTDYFLNADLPQAIFLTVTTLKDPEKLRHGVHTCEAFTFMSYDGFKKWAATKYGDRPEDYLKLKDELKAKMFRALEKRIPGITEKVVFSDLATPLTNVHYINATRGNLYGIEKSRSQVGPGAFAIKSEIENLFLCGASTLSHGVAGVTMTGMDAAKKILKCKMSELLTHKVGEIRIIPAEK